MPDRREKHYNKEEDRQIAPLAPSTRFRPPPGIEIVVRVNRVVVVKRSVHPYVIPPETRETPQQLPQLLLF